MLRKLVISESQKNQIKTLHKVIFEDVKDGEVPFQGTLVDVDVLDTNGKPIPNTKVKFFHNGERIAYEKTHITDSNGSVKDVLLFKETEYISVNFKGNKENKDFLQKERIRLACSRKTTLEIEIRINKEKIRKKFSICYDNAYMKDVNNVYIRYENVKDSNKIKFEIDAEPIPQFEFTLDSCIKLTKLHYKNMSNVDSKKITIDSIGGIDKVKETSNNVKLCYIKFRKEYPSDTNILTNRLINVQKDLDIFGISLSKDEIKDIYGESKIMLLKNTIRKVVSESVENKTERTLIEERLKFSLSGINKRNLTESKKALRNERYRLINFGYNKELVRESFLDVMKGLYGNDDTNVLSDIKTRLGQRIADQVKNKQEEHEMILSAFNELSEEMIERAIKENRVDELSTEIATKALEIYKTQFGTEGLSGIMIASVDENKFKQEVAKLIEPAIKEITTKMDEKLKQVQDAVSGGINPTA